MNVGPGPVALLSGAVFAIGVFGLACRRDAWGLLISLDVLILASVIAFAGFTATGGGRSAPPQGEVVALAAVVVCVVQTLVGASLIALLRRRRETLDVDAYDAPEAETR